MTKPTHDLDLSGLPKHVVELVGKLLDDISYADFDDSRFDKNWCQTTNEIRRALRAFPRIQPPKEYVLPSWEEITGQNGETMRRVEVGGRYYTESEWNRLREATAKVKS